MKPSFRETLAKMMADRIGHGMEEKCYVHAEVAIEVIESYSFTATLTLMEAYRKAESNEDCAKILRLFCTDFQGFLKEFDPVLLRRIEEERREKANVSKDNS